jgi:integrase/recombinase XerD
MSAEQAIVRNAHLRRLTPASTTQELVAPFIRKSISDETRAAYARTIKQFFAFNNVHPTEVVPAHVISWRDQLRQQKRRARTISQKLAILRAFFSYLREADIITINPASTKFVAVPEIPANPTGRALTKKEARNLLAGPDQSKPEGARDYAMMLLMLRLSLRVSEVTSLRVSNMKWSHGRYILTCKIKGGSEEKWPLPADVREAINHYLKLDKKRRSSPPFNSGGDDANLFQPSQNYLTLVFDKPLSTRQVERIVTRWADYARIGKVTPHDLRRSCLTEMLKTYSYQDVQKVSKHKDPKTLMTYNHDRDNLENSPVNTFTLDD